LCFRHKQQATGIVFTGCLSGSPVTPISRDTISLSGGISMKGSEQGRFLVLHVVDGIG